MPRRRRRHLLDGRRRRRRRRRDKKAVRSPRGPSRRRQAPAPWRRRHWCRGYKYISHKYNDLRIFLFLIAIALIMTSSTFIVHRPYLAFNLIAVCYHGLLRRPLRRPPRRPPRRPSRMPLRRPPRRPLRQPSFVDRWVFRRSAASVGAVSTLFLRRRCCRYRRLRRHHSSGVCRVHHKTCRGRTGSAHRKGHGRLPLGDS